MVTKVYCINDEQNPSLPHSVQGKTKYCIYPGSRRTSSHPFRESCGGVVIMSTYEELSLIVSIALLVVAILNYTHKKIAVLP